MLVISLAEPLYLNSENSSFVGLYAIVVIIIISVFGDVNIKV